MQKIIFIFVTHELQNTFIWNYSSIILDFNIGYYRIAIWLLIFKGCAKETQSAATTNCLWITEELNSWYAEYYNIFQ